jgi:thiosulfate/3-mercaptopyruvate sulfurtransferase
MSRSSSPLVTVEWLVAHRSEPDVRVFDVRWYLAGKRGRDEYEKGHLPGAVFVDLDTDLAAPRGAGPGRHPLPRVEVFAETLARLGIGPKTRVIAYDDAGGAIAARLWWMLRHFGHDVGHVLDGGLVAWCAAGHPLENEPRSPVRAEPVALAARADVVDKAAVAELVRTGGGVLLDARGTPRFEGKSEPVDARPGHVPGARSAPFADNLVAPDGVFRAASELTQHYRERGALGQAPVVCYCGSGVTACHDVLALVLAGRSDVSLYEGSWSDWAADPALPAELGPERG